MVFSCFKHQGFVDDFDYGDDQDDQQRMEEKKRQLEQEANRLKTTRFVLNYLILKEHGHIVFYLLIAIGGFGGAIVTATAFHL